MTLPLVLCSLPLLACLRYHWPCQSPWVDAAGRTPETELVTAREMKHAYADAGTRVRKAVYTQIRRGRDSAADWSPQTSRRPLRVPPCFMLLVHDCKGYRIQRASLNKNPIAVIHTNRSVSSKTKQYLVQHNSSSTSTACMYLGPIVVPAIPLQRKPTNTHRDHIPRTTGPTHPASERCKHVGQPQNPSPPSTTIFFAAPADMHTLAPAPPVPDCSVVRLLLELRRGVDAPGPRAAFAATICAGDPAKEDTAGTKPSVLMHRLSAHRAVHRDLAMVPESGASRVNERRVCGVWKRGFCMNLWRVPRGAFFSLEISDLCQSLSVLLFCCRACCLVLTPSLARDFLS